MSDFRVMLMLLSAAEANHPEYQRLAVTESDGCRIQIHTGPDDAEAVFKFDPESGKLVGVSVVEAHGDLE
jgi:hypothetical protein